MSASSLPASSVVSVPEGLRPLHPKRSRSEEHTSELQSRLHLVCRLLLEKKNIVRGQRRNNALPKIQRSVKTVDSASLWSVDISQSFPQRLLFRRIITVKPRNDRASCPVN